MSTGNELAGLLAELTEGNKLSAEQSGRMLGIIETLVGRVKDLEQRVASLEAQR